MRGVCLGLLTQLAGSLPSLFLLFRLVVEEGGYMASEVVRHEVAIVEWSQDLGECPADSRSLRASRATEVCEARGKTAKGRPNCPD